MAGPEPQPVPRMAGYLPGVGAVDLDALCAHLASGKPVVPIIFYHIGQLVVDTLIAERLAKQPGPFQPAQSSELTQPLAE